MLHAIKVPVRDGQPLGDTQFRNMEAAYQDLPADIKKRLEGRTATHDFAKFWDMMRARSGSQRGALSPEQRAKKPPVAQPIFRVHPVTGRKILYCNPGYAVRIDGLSETEGNDLLDLLFTHQAREKYFYAHQWTEGDVVMWDNIGTTHNAVPDYRPDEPRYMRRVQVMATKDYARLVACAQADNQEMPTCEETRCHWPDLRPHACLLAAALTAPASRWPRRPRRSASPASSPWAICSST